MNLHFYHTLTGIGIFSFLLSKVLLHFYLDYRQKRSLGLSSLMISPVYYLRPYRLEVDEPLRKWKVCCNACGFLAIVALVLNLIVGLLIYYR